MNSLQDLPPERKWVLSDAAGDFFFFQNRSYPRPAALDWVGNRYNLSASERMLLRRGVFGQAIALSRQRKLQLGNNWQEELIFVDGHNVQITIESHIENRPLLRANDGAIRDLAGQSSRFRLSETGNLAIDMVFKFLENFPPREIIFLFDEPMSRSGELASIYRERLRKLHIQGEANAVSVPEKEFAYEKGIVASSDGAVIDSSARWIDLACSVIDYLGYLELTCDFSSLVLSNCKAKQLH